MVASSGLESKNNWIELHQSWLLGFANIRILIYFDSIRLGCLIFEYLNFISTDLTNWVFKYFYWISSDLTIDFSRLLELTNNLILFLFHFIRIVCLILYTFGCNFITDLTAWIFKFPNFFPLISPDFVNFISLGCLNFQTFSFNFIRLDFLYYDIFEIYCDLISSQTLMLELSNIWIVWWKSYLTAWFSDFSNIILIEFN